MLLMVKMMAMVMMLVMMVMMLVMMLVVKITWLVNSQSVMTPQEVSGPTNISGALRQNFAKYFNSFTKGSIISTENHHQELKITQINIVIERNTVNSRHCYIKCPFLGLGASFGQFSSSGISFHHELIFAMGLEF